MYRIIEHPGFTASGPGGDNSINNTCGFGKYVCELSRVGTRWRLEMAEIFPGSEDIFLLYWDGISVR